MAIASIITFIGVSIIGDKLFLKIIALVSILTNICLWLALNQVR
jgi:hypothetical protein